MLVYALISSCVGMYLAGLILVLLYGEAAVGPAKTIRYKIENFLFYTFWPVAMPSVFLYAVAWLIVDKVRGKLHQRRRRKAAEDKDTHL
jgi:hypothetical protein